MSSFLQAFLDSSPIEKGSITSPFHNALFGTGIGLMIASTALRNIHTYFSSYWLFLTAADAELIVASDDDSFSFLADFLAAHNSEMRPNLNLIERATVYLRRLLTLQSHPHILMRSLLVKSTITSTETEGEYIYERNRLHKPTLFYVPNDGDYILSFKDAHIHVSIFTDKEGRAKANENLFEGPRKDVITNSSSKTTITLSVYGHNHTILKQVIQASVDEFFAKQGNKIPVYTAAKQYGEYSWRKFSARSPRFMSSIMLPSSIKETLMNDVKSFLGSEEWYKRQGIPYRRGYMLHGPPGTGKSSFIFALATELCMSISIINLSSPGLTDMDLTTLLGESPKNTILVFEDVDVAMGRGNGDSKKSKDTTMKVEKLVNDTANNKNEIDKVVDSDKKQTTEEISSSLTENSTKSLVTLSGLLNSLDGIIAQEGHIVFLTTNHLSTLPPALLRPGRVDRRFLFPHATAQVTAHLFERFYEQDLGKDAAVVGAEIAKKLKIAEGRKFSVAQLQGFFLRHRDNPQAALDQVEEFLKEVELEAAEETQHLIY
ncbi:hypothetical protein HK100_001614 [Physocladia obscura]|uniref:Mitochondrial chaperone BCS1 n=1 Tax=Physocladia obscura TaxID=109957 RepID=A0AAD5SWJ2_9FUNG|nr:hypothetical protein HK100_001614 [Physocladia obscura]